MFEAGRKVGKQTDRDRGRKRARPRQRRKNKGGKQTAMKKRVTNRQIDGHTYGETYEPATHERTDRVFRPSDRT